MKVCHAEVMKMIKELEAQKTDLIEKEERCSRVSYKEGEPRSDDGYEYAATRAAVHELDGRIRTLRAVLAKANCSVAVDDFGITIGEALVMLAQMQNERTQLSRLAGFRQLDREITYSGVVEYTQCLYDVNVAAADERALREKIVKLQVAIDRANLTNFVEI